MQNFLSVSGYENIYQLIVKIKYNQPFKLLFLNQRIYLRQIFWNKFIDFYKMET